MSHLISLLFLALLAAVALLLAGSVTLRARFKARPSAALRDPEDTELGRRFASRAANHPGQSGFSLLDSGLEAFVARALLADAAERTLDVQYYLLHDDRTGKLIVERLLAAADRGVRVRLLVDDTTTLGREYSIATFDRHPHFEVRVFNPFVRRRTSRISRFLEFGMHPWRLNHRMHNKLFVADNAVAIVGGRNIGDEYFEARPDVNFKDLDLLAVGPVVREVSACFDEYWNSLWAIPVAAFPLLRLKKRALKKARKVLEAHRSATENSEYAAQLRKTDLLSRLEDDARSLSWGPAQVVYDRPRKISPRGNLDPSAHLGPQLLPRAVETRQELIIVTPYLVPREEGMALFTRLRQRGVRVRILTNSLASTDVTIVHTGYARYRERMLRLGIELFELKPSGQTGWRKFRRKIIGAAAASLHAKMLAFDRATVFVGSFNLDPRSARLNTEMGLVVESPDLGQRVAALFEEAVAPRNSFQVRLSECPGDAVGARSRDRLVWLTGENGREVRYDHEPQASLWRRGVAAVLSLFPVENQL